MSFEKSGGYLTEQKTIQLENFRHCLTPDQRFQTRKKTKFDIYPEQFQFKLSKKPFVTSAYWFPCKCIFIHLDIKTWKSFRTHSFNDLNSQNSWRLCRALTFTNYFKCYSPSTTRFIWFEIQHELPNQFNSFAILQISIIP